MVQVKYQVQPSGSMWKCKVINQKSKEKNPDKNKKKKGGKQQNFYNGSKSNSKKKKKKLSNQKSHKLSLHK